MNKDSPKIRIYLKIIDYLQVSNRNGYYPTVANIINKLDTAWGIHVGTRTMNRHISDLKYKFHVGIVKQEGKRGGYEIRIESVTDFNKIYETFRILEKAGYFQEMLENSGELLQYISFDGKQFTGYHHVETILTAITKKRVITIVHKKFDDKEMERKVKPWLLKEYHNRWYLVGYDFASNEMRTFGLDRIGQIKITDEKFDSTEADLVKNQFENRIGIVGINPPEEIVLKFDNSQIEYFRTYPWHKSAHISQDENGDWIVKMFVSVNYELEQLILMNQAFVQVMEPKHLVDSVKKLLAKALEKYS